MRQIPKYKQDITTIHDRVVLVLVNSGPMQDRDIVDLLPDIHRNSVSTIISMGLRKGKFVRTGFTLNKRTGRYVRVVGLAERKVEGLTS